MGVRMYRFQEEWSASTGLIDIWENFAKTIFRRLDLQIMTCLCLSVVPFRVVYSVVCLYSLCFSPSARLATFHNTHLGISASRHLGISASRLSLVGKPNSRRYHAIADGLGRHRSTAGPRLYQYVHYYMLYTTRPSKADAGAHSVPVAHEF